MGFFSGSASFTRYEIVNLPPEALDPERFLEALTAKVYGTQKQARKDGANIGWIAGETIGDKVFALEKNQVERIFHFQMRVTANKIPAEIYKDFLAEEKRALTFAGKPTKNQKQEAKEAAQDRIDQMAKDGRWLRSKLIPIWFDAEAREILFGSTSSQAQSLFHLLCTETFGTDFALKTAGTIALDLVETEGLENGIQDAKPSSFISSGQGDQPAWIPDLFCRDFIGNEFLVWLWYQLSGSKGKITIHADGQEIEAFLSKSMTLTDRSDQIGQTITSESPANVLSMRALQAGALPRKVGIMIGMPGSQVASFTLAAESFGITGLKLPSPEETEPSARRSARVKQMREFLTQLDLVYQTFLVTRANHTLWTKELAKIRKWIQTDREERKAG